MDFAFDQTQLAFKESIIRFAQKELNEGIESRDKEGRFNYEGWKKLAGQNIFALPVPEEYGGIDADILTIILSMEGLGYGCQDNGLIFAVNSQMWSCIIPVLEFGSEAQKQKYLPKLVRGEWIGGHAMTEPEAGSDAFSIRTSAKKINNSYILNGEKTFITNAPIADLLIVFARTSKTSSFAGISAFIVEKDRPGFTISKDMDKMGLRTSPLGYLVFDNCEIPEENLLGREGLGAAIFNAEMEWERSCLFASHIGVMERLMEQAIHYAKHRSQFGQTINKFQSVSHKIADMKTKIELARLMLYKIGWLKMQGKKAPVESAIAKLFVSESLVKTALDTIQIFGANGYMTEYNLERQLRDAIGSTIYSGSSEIQKNIIASWLGL